MEQDTASLLCQGGPDPSRLCQARFLCPPAQQPRLVPDTLEDANWLEKQERSGGRDEPELLDLYFEKY